MLYVSRFTSRSSSWLERDPRISICCNHVVAAVRLLMSRALMRTFIAARRAGLVPAAGLY